MAKLGISDKLAKESSMGLWVDRLRDSQVYPRDPFYSPEPTSNKDNNNPEDGLWRKIKTKLFGKRKVREMPEESLDTKDFVESHFYDAKHFNKFCAPKRMPVVKTMMKQTESLMDEEYQNYVSIKGREEKQSDTREEDWGTSPVNYETDSVRSKTPEYKGLADNKNLEHLLKKELETDRVYIETMMTLLVKDWGK